MRFLTRRGYRLEQIERISFLDLPVADDGAGRRITISCSSGFVGSTPWCTWTGGTPPEWIPDLIVLRTRMSTDAPFAGLDIDEEPWTEARIATRDAAMATDGRTGADGRRPSTNRPAGWSGSAN